MGQPHQVQSDLRTCTFVDCHQPKMCLFSSCPFLLCPITSQLYRQFCISTVLISLITSNVMPRPRKLLELTPQSEARWCGCISYRPTTILFYNSIKFSFREWLKGRKNRELFDSTKQIRYRRFLEDLNGEISGTKAERAVKFNELTMHSTIFYSRIMTYTAGHSIAKQIEVPLVSRRVEAVDNPPSKRKRQAQTPTSKPAEKRSPVDQSLPTSLATRSKSNKS